MDGKQRKVVTFGEIMMRLSPPDHLRFGQANSFDVSYGGGEANVAASLAHFGLDTEFITRIPANDIGEACIHFLRQHNLGTRHIVRGGDRLGIYFLEQGAIHRSSKVIYDRAASSFATLLPGMIDWEAAFEGATWFHWSGITPAVSESAATACREAIQVARRLGLTVSCDMNYRAKLWKWGKPAGEVMRELVGLCDAATGNEEDADKVFGIRAPDTDVTSGKVDPENYRIVCRQLSDLFPNLRLIAFTLRGSLSASHNSWSGVLWHGGDGVLRGPTYEITPIIDRVGAGDSFVAGLIYSMLIFGDDHQRALDFAVAASALKHTVFGDFNLVSVPEVEALVEGDLSGRVRR